MVFLTREVHRHVSIIALSLVCTSHPLVAQPTLEDDVKAAFLYNFTKFIEWPPPAQPDEPFRLCALADAPFIAILDRTIADEAVGGRPLVRVAPQSVEEARSCAVLYIGKSAGDRGARLAAGVRDLPVLTVGEGTQFIKQGGAIGFLLENHRVRFGLRACSLQRCGLKASSKLLRVARTVDGGVS